MLWLGLSVQNSWHYGTIKSIFGLSEFGAQISPVWRWRWTPLSTPIIFSMVVYRSPAMRTVSCNVIFEKFNHISAILTCYIENCVWAPFLCVISSTFSHIFHLIELVGKQSPRPPMLSSENQMVDWPALIESWEVHFSIFQSAVTLPVLNAQTGTSQPWPGTQHPDNI